MAKTPRGKHHEREGAKDLLKIFKKAGISRSQLAADARRQAKDPKGGKK